MMTAQPEAGDGGTPGSRLGPFFFTLCCTALGSVVLTTVLCNLPFQGDGNLLGILYWSSKFVFEYSPLSDIEFAFFVYAAPLPQWVAAGALVDLVRWWRRMVVRRHRRTA